MFESAHQRPAGRHNRFHVRGLEHDEHERRTTLLYAALVIAAVLIIAIFGDVRSAYAGPSDPNPLLESLKDGKWPEHNGC